MDWTVMRPHWTLDVEENRSCRFDNSINTTNRYGRHVVCAVHFGTSFSRIFRFQLFHLTLVKVVPFHILLMVPLCLVSLGPQVDYIKFTITKEKFPCLSHFLFCLQS